MRRNWKRYTQKTQSNFTSFKDMDPEVNELIFYRNGSMKFLHESLAEFQGILCRNYKKKYCTDGFVSFVSVV